MDADNPRFATATFATIQNNVSYENRRTKTLKNYRKVKKCATLNTRYKVKEKHSQLEMGTIPIHRLSQSGSRLRK